MNLVRSFLDCITQYAASVALAAHKNQARCVVVSRDVGDNGQRNESLKTELDRSLLVWSPVCRHTPAGPSSIKSLGAAILPMVAPLIGNQDEMK